MASLTSQITCKVVLRINVSTYLYLRDDLRSTRDLTVIHHTNMGVVGTIADPVLAKIAVVHQVPKLDAGRICVLLLVSGSCILTAGCW
jgi:hypothetical protein